jgi:dihydropyrimidinase
MTVNEGEVDLAMRTLIRNGTIATDRDVFQGDILILDGHIHEVSERIDAPDAEIIDAAGKLVLPGAVDIHTHMDLDVGIARVIDDFYTGTVAAACGGTTTIVDHMAFGPAGCSPWHQVKAYHRLADGNAVVDYGFHGVLQHVDDAALDAMAEIAAEEGITSFKAYMTYDYMLDDLSLMRVLERAREAGILIAAHCENHGIVTALRERFAREGKTQAKWHPVSRPPDAEAEAVNRLLTLARTAGEAPVYVVHLSSRLGLEALGRARAAGQRHIGAETCPQYLLLDEALYDDPQEGLKAIMAPPLRRAEDRAALWDALAAGRLDTVATDHCPFTFARQKQQGADDFTKCPSGAPGVEERLILLYSEGVAKGRITLPQLVQYACANPARVAGLYPRKGVIAPGSDADLVLLDPDREWTLTTARMHGNSDYTCYEGMKVRGAVERVLLRGKTIIQNGAFTGARGDGRYLRRGKSVLCQ